MTKDNKRQAILCLLCMEDYQREYIIPEIGISLFFCDAHYPKDWPLSRTKQKESN